MPITGIKRKISDLFKSVTAKNSRGRYTDLLTGHEPNEQTMKDLAKTLGEKFKKYANNAALIADTTTIFNPSDVVYDGTSLYFRKTEGLGYGLIGDWDVVTLGSISAPLLTYTSNGTNDSVPFTTYFNNQKSAGKPVIVVGGTLIFNSNIDLNFSNVIVVGLITINNSSFCNITIGNYMPEFNLNTSSGFPNVFLYDCKSPILDGSFRQVACHNTYLKFRFNYTTNIDTTIRGCCIVNGSSPLDVLTLSYGIIWDKPIFTIIGVINTVDISCENGIIDLSHASVNNIILPPGLSGGNTISFNDCNNLTVNTDQNDFKFNDCTNLTVNSVQNDFKFNNCNNLTVNVDQNEYSGYKSSMNTFKFNIIAQLTLYSIDNHFNGESINNFSSFAFTEYDGYNYIKCNTIQTTNLYNSIITCNSLVLFGGYFSKSNIESHGLLISIEPSSVFINTKIKYNIGNGSINNTGFNISLINSDVQFNSNDFLKYDGGELVSPYNLYMYNSKFSFGFQFDFGALTPNLIITGTNSNYNIKTQDVNVIDNTTFTSSIIYAL